MGNHDPKAWEQGDQIQRAQEEMTFVSLHHHTTFSYKDGFGTPEQHVVRAAEIGMTALGITEHGNVTSHPQLEQAAKKHGVKPIFGCELYCGEVGEAATQKKNHLTVLAMDQRGYRNLLSVVSRGWAEGFYYEPTVSGEMLREHNEGLVVTSGCSGSLLATSLVGGKNIDVADASYERARLVARKFRGTFGDRYYLEVQAFPELENTRNINAGISQLAKDLGIPLVATLDVHYTRPDESFMQQILHNVRGGFRKTMEELDQSWGYDIKLAPLTDSDVFRRLVATGLSSLQASQAIRNAREIAERCNVELPKVDNVRYPLPEGCDDPVYLFRQWINEGWKYRGLNRSLDDKERARYIERCKYEMSLIEKKGFVDYFLVISDAVRYAKDNGVPVGPARGSAAASLVCYLLRITEVNPMLFPTLLFERFIDLNRHDLPDIDLDFDDERRYMVRDYLVAKYGEDRVGNIGTFTRYKGKNSIDDVARALRIPSAAAEELKGLAIERSSGDLRASNTLEDTIEMFPRAKEIVEQYPDLLHALKLEGNVRGMSVHAAGLVIANEPLQNFCAVYTREDSSGEVAQVVSLDKWGAEYLNVMKFDALGLKTMGMIRIALEEIGMTLDELYNIQLEDPDTIRGFQENDVVGIFQFDGRAMRSVNQGVCPDTFMEICDCNALARPGPLHSGATAEYIDAKHGRKTPTHYHPHVDSITKHTQYQVVYQEQILQIVRQLGRFSWEEAARIRKIISKKRGESEFRTMRDKFIKGSAEEGLEESEADKVFGMLATAGAYAFNAAHCVSYGMLAYWTMWLKRNHPVAFYVASLRKCGGDIKGKERQAQLLRDARKKGVKVGSLKLNRSGRSWTVDGEFIRPGYTQMHGIGDKMAERILQAREEIGGRFSGWVDLQAVHGIGPSKIAAIKEFINHPDPFELDLLSNTISKVKKELYDGVESGDSLGGLLPSPTHRSIDVPYDRTDSNVPVVWLGVIRNRNLKDLEESHYSKTGEHLDMSTQKDPHLKEWVVMLGEDETEPIIVTVNRWQYPKFKDTIWSIEQGKDLVLVRGVKYGFQARRAIYVHDMWVLQAN